MTQFDFEKDELIVRDIEHQLSAREQSLSPYRSTEIEPSEFAAFRNMGSDVDKNGRVDAAGIRAAALVATSRTPVQRGSTSTPNAGLLGIRFPYLSIVRPRVEYPSLYNEHFGRPTNISDLLKNFEGYTVVSEIHLDGVSATMPEKEEIENLLKGGVIL